MMLTLSPTEYEKLGIAAVKKGMTRHQVLRTALDTHLERLKANMAAAAAWPWAAPARTAAFRHSRV